MKCFSKVTNEMFYGLNGDSENSILKELKENKINNNKVMLIIHHLYLMTNRCGESETTIDWLIKKCNYTVDKDNRKDFKDILIKLKELNFIDFDIIGKSNEMIVINTENLNVDSNFFIIENEEIELISTYTKDIRETINTMKIYFYLKARCHKGNDTNLGGKANATFNTYEDISKNTLINECNIKKYIDILQEIGLIKYKNLGYKYKESNRQYKTECANLYALTNISKDMIDKDLTEGLKQQRYYYEDKGYIITSKGYKYNDKKANGLYGSLVKKEKNNTLTDEEENKLEVIRMKMTMVKELEQLSK